jgi:D-glycero-D-manno-heptose 1,7-bisphosphate phosphatase
MVIAHQRKKMKTILLDRDGVINFDSPLYIKAPAEWRPIPGSIEAIAALSQAGYAVIVVTNQSGLARGLYDVDTLDAIHEKMRQAIVLAGGTLAGIFYCPHLPDALCVCRKPEPGLFYHIRDAFKIDLTGVWMIGDSLRDLQAAEKVACQPVLVKTGNGLKTLRKHDLLPANTLIFNDLYAASQYLLAT